MRRPDADSFFRYLGAAHPEWCEVIVDIGVERDTPFLRKNFPRSKHILVECEASYYPGLAESYKDIAHELVPAAMGTGYGSYHLFQASIRDDGEVSHTCLETNPGKAAERIAAGDNQYAMVDVIPADHIYRKFGLQDRKYITKIDIDSIESEVIAASDELFPNSAIVMVECPLWWDNGLPARYQAALQKGLYLIDIVAPCYYQDKLWQIDLVFINQELRSQYYGDPYPLDVNKWQGSF